jgi:hypothetical protein
MIRRRRRLEQPETEAPGQAAATEAQAAAFLAQLAARTGDLRRVKAPEPLDYGGEDTGWAEEEEAG